MQLASTVPDCQQPMTGIAPTNASWFQFSLSQMLLAVTFFSIAFATLSRLLEILRHMVGNYSAVDILAILLFPLVFASLLGAAVGTLFNQTRRGANLAVKYLMEFIAVIMVDALLIGAAVWIWFRISMS